MANGAVIPNTEIAVDYWRPKACTRVKHFFLSHMHSDHIQGLTPSWRNKLYCSEVTKKLLIHKFGIRDDIIIDIEIGTPKIIDHDFCVTLFDANHCPGAVMFLFEGVFGRILYTADFRCDANMLESFRSRSLVDVVVDSCNPCSLGAVDVVYVDNTYFDKAVQFPSKEEATEEIFKIIERHPFRQVLFVCYSLGKEDLLVKLATRLSEWIIVSQEKMDLLKVLEVPNVFSVNTQDGRNLSHSRKLAIT